MYHLDFHGSLRMSPKYRGWNEIGFLKNGWWKISVKMGCNEIIITCTWNACIIEKSRTKKIIRNFFQAYIGHSKWVMFWTPISISVASGILVFSPSLFVFMCSLVFFSICSLFSSLCHWFLSLFLGFLQWFHWFSLVCSLVFYGFLQLFNDFVAFMLEN